MYKHILIATDGSEIAGKALDEGLELAKQISAKVTVLTASEPWSTTITGEATFGFPLEEYEKAATENAKRILASATETAKQRGIECTVQHAKDQYPANAILDAAKESGCDLIVMASHGRGAVGRLLLGSESVRVLTHSPVPVLICR